MRILTEYGYYDLEPLPGNPQVCVSTHLMTFKKHRGKGLGVQRCKARIRIARGYGYKYMLATVRADNIAEKRVLAKSAGWEYKDVFLNHDGDAIELWGIAL